MNYGYKLCVSPLLGQREETSMVGWSLAQVFVFDSTGKKGRTMSRCVRLGRGKGVKGVGRQGHYRKIVRETNNIYDNINDDNDENDNFQYDVI